MNIEKMSYEELKAFAKELMRENEILRDKDIIYSSAHEILNSKYYEEQVRDIGDTIYPIIENDFIDYYCSDNENI